ncbi:hypothetical protein Goklo_003838, partial [Gossypium klotzschianum]|nr:hypothetical protein [Gossypium klotzschianum]
FVSIDCGVEDDYFDNSTGIWFKSDTEFISSGENHDTLPEYFLNNDKEQFGKRYETVRSFPNGMKNCYTLKLEQAKNNSFRIRASFAYGNYDHKNKIPKFDLYLGVNYWATVNLPNFQGFFYEIIHVFPADTEYVCLANTGTGTPFISALEIRPSNISTYGNGSSLELLNIRLYDLSSDPGQSPGVSIFWNRYKDDIYDRVWFPYQPPRSVPINTSLDIDTQGSGSLYKLPVEVLRTAVRPFNGSNSLNYSSSFASSYEYNLYFHFAELEYFEDKQREISITVNGITQGPFTLEYLKPLSISFQRLRTVEGNITFTISTTMESGLPPILNALEYYVLEQFTDSATDPSDEVVNNTIASNKEGFLKSKNQPFTYSEIVTITANFETGIGEGGFGKVFRGHLNDGTPVAVKLLSSSSKQGYKEFQA